MALTQDITTSVDAMVARRLEETTAHLGGLRLAINFNELSKTGRYNPVLSDNDVKFVTHNAHLPAQEVYTLAKELAWKP